MATGRLTGSLRSYGRAGARIQDAIMSRAARPRKLALAAYALFALAFVASFPQWAAIAVGAVVLNGLITLAGTTAVAAFEGRWTPSLRCPDVPLRDRSLQYATLIWFYSAGLFGWLAVAARL